MSRHVRVYDANGFAEPDQIVTERVPKVSAALLSGSASYECHCRDGYSGPGCSIALPEDVGCPNACSGHGSCGPLCDGVRCNETFPLRQGCTCDTGYEGADCGTASVATCPNACSGHGSCVNSVCECNIGYGGEDCTQPVAAPSPPFAPPPPPPPHAPPTTAVRTAAGAPSTAAGSEATMDLMSLTGSVMRTMLIGAETTTGTAGPISIPAEDGSGASCRLSTMAFPLH